MHCFQVKECQQVNKIEKRKLQEASQNTSAKQKAHKESTKAISSHQTALEDAIRAKKAADEERCSAEASQKVPILLTAAHCNHYQHLSKFSAL